MKQQEWKTTGEITRVTKGIISPAANDICKHKGLGKKKILQLQTYS